MKDEELFFDALKFHRESKDIEISEICEFTKINSRYIEAIENGEFKVLPTIYMRLFLRAYAKFIGADPDKALEDFELYTTGKIQKKSDIDLIPAEDSSRPNMVKVSVGSTSQITLKKIATGVAVIFGIFLLLYWAGQITNEQTSEVKKTSAPIEEKMMETPPIQETEPVPINNSGAIDGSAKKKIPQLSTQ